MEYKVIYNKSSETEGILIMKITKIGILIMKIIKTKGILIMKINKKTDMLMKDQETNLINKAIYIKGILK